MKRAILASQDKTPFSPVARMLEQRGVRLEHVNTGKALLEQLSNADLIIISSSLTDMAPKALIQAVVAKSPFTHCVVAGDMEKKAFHDFYEGYGVLMQIPEIPNQDAADQLALHLDKLSRLGSC